MTRTPGALAAAALLLATGLGSPAWAEVPDSSDPIKLTLHDWTGQLVTTEIMGRVL
jgi:glycine betaine/proline transport system substrate-binding protein